MDIICTDNSIQISGLADFSLGQCLCCGQAFRWTPQEDGFFGVALGRAVYARQTGDTLTLDGAGKADAAGFVRYFDLERDYGAVKKMYAHDAFLQQGMAYAHGMRVLRQPVFETLISFIISANNNVARISRIIDTLCQRYGRPVGAGFDFPSYDVLAQLTEDDLKACGAGYRARYIIETAKMVADGFDLEALSLLPFEEARQKLTALPGVGLKVADCVSLYALGFTEAFPADVWMRRVLCGLYGYKGKNDIALRKFVNKNFGIYAGLAQQYLFHFARNHPEIFRCP